VKLKLLIFLLVFISINIYSQRTLFVDEFNIILGSPTKEDKLLSFAKSNNFTSLILYQLNKVDKRLPLIDPRKNNVLSEFIAKAKLKYDITSIGASGESASFFTNRIQVYNNSRSKPEEKFDVYNLEFEYWSKKASSDGGYYCENYLRDNNQPCSRIGSFNYFINDLKELKRLSNESNHKVEIDAYVGYFTKNEILEISNYCDRILLHTSGKSPKMCFSSAKKSLEILSKIKSKIKTSIFFSTRMNNMGYWLKFDSLDSGEANFFDVMKIKNSSLKKNINIAGFSYHTYSFLEKSISYYRYRNN
jgi:hypothetical protein